MYGGVAGKWATARLCKLSANKVRARRKISPLCFALMIGERNKNDSGKEIDMTTAIKEPITQAPEAYAPSPWDGEFARQMWLGCIASFGPSRREEQRDSLESHSLSMN